MTASPSVFAQSSICVGEAGLEFGRISNYKSSRRWRLVSSGDRREKRERRMRREINVRKKRAAGRRRRERRGRRRIVALISRFPRVVWRRARKKMVGGNALLYLVVAYTVVAERLLLQCHSQPKRRGITRACIHRVHDAQKRGGGGGRVRMAAR